MDNAEMLANIVKRTPIGSDPRIKEVLNRFSQFNEYVGHLRTASEVLEKIKERKEKGNSTA
jgi:hypothetical protein